MNTVQVWASGHMGDVAGVGRGGWGALIVDDGKYRLMGSYSDRTSKYMMEVMALAGPVSVMSSPVHIDLYTNSMNVVYAVRRIVEHRKWKKGLACKELWRDVRNNLRGFEITAKHVPGRTEQLIDIVQNCAMYCSKNQVFIDKYVDSISFLVGRRSFNF